MSVVLYGVLADIGVPRLANEKFVNTTNDMEKFCGAG